MWKRLLIRFDSLFVFYCRNENLHFLFYQSIDRYSQIGAWVHYEKRWLKHQIYFHSLPQIFLLFFCTGQKVPLCQCVFRQLPQEWTDYLYKTHPDIKTTESVSECTFQWASTCIFYVSYNPKGFIIYFNLFQQTYFYCFYWYSDYIILNRLANIMDYAKPLANVCQNTSICFMRN